MKTKPLLIACAAGVVAAIILVGLWLRRPPEVVETTARPDAGSQSVPAPPPPDTPGTRGSFSNPPPVEVVPPDKPNPDPPPLLPGPIERPPDPPEINRIPDPPEINKKPE